MANRIKVPAKMSAIAAGATEDLVLKVRARKRKTGPKARKVMKADELLQDGMNNLLEEVKRVVNF